MGHFQQNRVLWIHRYKILLWFSHHYAYPLSSNPIFFFFQTARQQNIHVYYAWTFFVHLVFFCVFIDVGSISDRTVLQIFDMGQPMTSVPWPLIFQHQRLMNFLVNIQRETTLNKRIFKERQLSIIIFHYNIDLPSTWLQKIFFQQNIMNIHFVVLLLDLYQENSDFIAVIFP
jgi:hypothetical protein